MTLQLKPPALGFQVGRGPQRSGQLRRPHGAGAPTRAGRPEELARGAVLAASECCGLVGSHHGAGPTTSEALKMEVFQEVRAFWPEIIGGFCRVLFRQTSSTSWPDIQRHAQAWNEALRERQAPHQQNWSWWRKVAKVCDSISF